MDIVKKLQNKPERDKKIIIWTVLIIIGLLFLSLWIYGSQKSIKQLKVQDVMEDLNLPAKQDIPQMQGPDDQDWQELEDLLNQLDQEDAE